MHPIYLTENKISYTFPSFKHFGTIKQDEDIDFMPEGLRDIRNQATFDLEEFFEAIKGLSEEQQKDFVIKRKFT